MLKRIKNKIVEAVKNRFGYQKLTSKQVKFIVKIIEK